MTNNSISLKVSQKSILFFTHTYDRLSILYINFPQVFLRIAKLCKQTTATIVAKLALSCKCNGVLKQWYLFLSIPKVFSMVLVFLIGDCLYLFLQVMKDFVKESKDGINKGIQHLPTKTHQQDHFQILSIPVDRVTGKCIPRGTCTPVWERLD